MLAKVNKRVLLTAVLFLALSIAHIPNKVWPHIFDKNQAPQFFVILIISVLFAGYILKRSINFRLHKYLYNAILALLGILLISTITSVAPLYSLIGETGRYSGVVGLLALLIVALFHTNFTFEQFIQLIKLYLIPIVLVALLGIFQYYKVLDFPGAAGVVATTGNPDFFSALLGVSAPLFVLAGYKTANRNRVILAIGFLINIYALQLCGRRQGFVDIALALICIAIIKYRKFLPKLDWSLNAKSALAAFLLVIWTEIIFLVPFLGSKIPLFGNDTNIKVRANYWVTATRQFVSHPFFGVGPDQYGNYYEQYRTKQDALGAASEVSNDAHSASVQTLATLGIFGAILLFMLLVILIRSSLVLVKRMPERRIEIYLLATFLFIYITNSFASPMIFPAKYLLWAVAGWVVGQVYREREVDMAAEESNYRSFNSPVIISAVLAMIVFVGFGASFINFSNKFETYAKNQNGKYEISSSSFLPCSMYFAAGFQTIRNQSNDVIEKYARDAVNQNPRCIDARIVLAEVYAANKNYSAQQTEIKKLLEIGPARNQVITLGIDYVKATGDQAVANRLSQIMSRLGLVYVPGK